MTELLNPRLSEHPTMEEMEEFFGKDKYATALSGCKIIEGWQGHGVAEMEITENHKNAQGAVMGGAIFTLADFALAIACNTGDIPTVNLQSSITFLRSTKGNKLIAEANCVKPGHRVPVFEVKVTDDLGKEIAQVSVVCFKHDK